MESKYLRKYLKGDDKAWNYKEYKGQSMEVLVAVNEVGGIDYCKTGNNFHSHNIAFGAPFYRCNAQLHNNSG